MTNDDDEPQLIYVLHSRIQYLDRVVEILKHYLDTVKQKLKEAPGDMKGQVAFLLSYLWNHHHAFQRFALL